MKKTWILIGILMLTITICIVAGSYAKYSSSASAHTETPAGAWIVKVNNTDISAENVITNFTISNLSYPNSQYVAQNKIAPGSNGYFDIVIDPTGCSTAIQYDVTLDTSELSLINSIRLESAALIVNGVEDVTGIVRTGENTYSGIIDLDDVKDETTSTVRFYIRWEDDGTGVNDNTDTAIGLTQNISAEIPVQVVVSQYRGETLEEYEEEP